MNSGWVRFVIRDLLAAQQQECDCGISSVVCSHHLFIAECVQDGEINKDPFSANTRKEMKEVSNAGFSCTSLYSAPYRGWWGEEDTQLNFPNIIIVLQITLFLREVFDHSWKE